MVAFESAKVKVTFGVDKQEVDEALPKLQLSLRSALPAHSANFPTSTIKENQNEIN